VIIKYNRNIVVLMGNLLYLHTNPDSMLLQTNTTMNIYLRMYKWLEWNIWKFEYAGGGSVAALDVEGVDLCDNLI
jgi:hypothetical protein